MIPSENRYGVWAIFAVIVLGAALYSAAIGIFGFGAASILCEIDRRSHDTVVRELRKANETVERVERRQVTGARLP